MRNYENKTKEDLLEIIEQLEKKIDFLSSHSSDSSSPSKGRFRDKYSTRILDALPDMLTVFDHDANIIELASSPATNHVEGISPNNITTTNVKDILPKEAYESVRKNMDKVILTGESSTARHDLMLDGVLHHYENRIFPLDKEYLLCMCRDISQQWEAEQTNAQQQKELKAARIKAEESDRLKSAFLANMSHEIRTPLNAIVGFSNLLPSAENVEEEKLYSRIINQNSEILLQLINDILDLSKIEAGTLEYVKQPMNLGEVCRNIYEIHKGRVQEGVTLILDNKEDDLIIEEDRNRIMQVITNFITNATKFTYAGEIRFGFKIENHCIHVYVKDTGIGIEASKVDHIFDRFVKLNSFAQGTGLGLAICRMIIEKIGGEIGVTSETGKGSTFFFTIPYKENSDEHITFSDAFETKYISHTIKRMQKIKKILVAEDVDSNFVLVKNMIGKEYTLLWAKDGFEAVEMYKRYQPDLILMDIKMPRMDGLEATRIIRSYSKEIPVIALTAYAFETDKEQAFEAGCTDFVTKPVSREALEKALGKYSNLTM